MLQYGGCRSETDQCLIKVDGGKKKEELRCTLNNSVSNVCVRVCCLSAETLYLRINWQLKRAKQPLNKLVYSGGKKVPHDKAKTSARPVLCVCVRACWLVCRPCPCQSLWTNLSQWKKLGFSVMNCGSAHSSQFDSWWPVRRPALLGTGRSCLGLKSRENLRSGWANVTCWLV